MEATTPTDLTGWRDEFPVLEHKTYLISASLGPVSRRSKAYLEEYLDAWGTKGAPDHVWFEDIFPRMGALKRSFSGLAGCDPDEVALTRTSRSRCRRSRRAWTSRATGGP